MSGSVTQYKKMPGRWLVRWDRGEHPETSGRQQVAKVINGTREDAQKFLRETLYKLDLGLDQADRKMFVHDLVSSFLADMEGTVRTQTLNTYKLVCRTYINPLMGKEKSSSVDQRRINRFKKQLVAYKGKQTKKPISPQTQLHVMRILSMIFDHGLKYDLVARNPVKAVRKPKVQKSEIKTVPHQLLPDILRWLNEHSPSSVLPTLVAVLTGMRRGEVLGLKWSDIVLDNGQSFITVQRSLVESGNHIEVNPTKTKAGSRRVELPSSLVAPLVEWKRDLREKWEILPSDTNGYVFGIPITKRFPLRPGGLSLAFKRAVTALGHGDLNFHALRHTYATTLLEQGEHPLVVSTNLGHSDIQVTLNTYSHVTPALQRRAAEAMDEVLGKELIESRELVAIP